MIGTKSSTSQGQVLQGVTDSHSSAADINPIGMFYLNSPGLVLTLDYVLWNITVFILL